MNQKPTLMNKEWDDHLRKVEWALSRILKLEERIDILEDKFSDLKISEETDDSGPSIEKRVEKLERRLFVGYEE